MKVNKKLQVWLPLIFSVVLIAGMYLGYGLGNAGNFFKRDKSTTLQQAVDIINRNYVDKVNLDSLQGDAIQEMMTHLDPHSVYFPPVDLKEAKEELDGKFEGIGVEFNVFADTVNIVYVIPGGPSDQAGLQIGDKIIKVNDYTIAGKPLSTDSIKWHIRGEKGSKVNLQIFRNGKLVTITVTRATVPVPSIDAAYMVDKTTGYIKLNKFTITSYEEFMQALENLQKQGLKKLIFDLRGNGGGYMDDAINMADEFLSGDKLIVYTQGENKPKVEHRAKRPGLFEEGELVILVDELSASASEVLTGSLQDWDRATIIGRRTFGKGLVQQQFDLDDGSAIRLTIARYYTPLGRSIQRPYDKGKKVYMDEIWNRYSNGEALYADSNKVSNGKKFTTPKGKVVYGGGGIMPDIFVPIDTSSYPHAVSKVLLNGTFNSFVYNYYLQHRSQLDNYPSADDYAHKFDRMEELWNQFIQFTARDSVNPATISEQQKQSLKIRLEASLARFKWRSNGFYEVLNQDDPVMKRALEVLGN
jgi:carboxyl-terminal processing protease